MFLELFLAYNYLRKSEKSYGPFPLRRMHIHLIYWTKLHIISRSLHEALSEWFMGPSQCAESGRKKSVFLLLWKGSGRASSNLLTVLECTVHSGDDQHLLSFYYLSGAVYSSYPKVSSGLSLPNLFFLQPSLSQVTPAPSFPVLR